MYVSAERPAEVPLAADVFKLQSDLASVFEFRQFG